VGILILVLIIVASVLVGLLIYFLKKDSKPATDVLTSTIANDAIEDVEHIFNNEFREELRNRGRLHFEKIIGENAMFLQQDLRLTTSQLNDYMKQEITRTLKNEFSKYEESINNAKQLAVESIEKTQATIEEQRQLMTQQLTDQFSAERTRMISRFENHMADVVNHYIMTAIGNQIDLSDQLEFILKDLNDNKEAIIEDIKNGA
jgi:F0F1-type ATP synthase membrane subunit b/b'